MPHSAHALYGYTLIAQAGVPQASGNPSDAALGVSTPAAPGAAGTPAPAQKPGQPPFDIFMFMIPLLVIFILMTVMSGRREKKKRQELMSSLKKGDYVLTIGGVLGDVIELRDDEVVLKVEDGRIRFSRSSIQSVVRSAGTKGASTSESKPDGKPVSV